ncbi:tyrosine-protein kinase, non-receptor Jak2 [Tanacetum coccineum]
MSGDGMDHLRIPFEKIEFGRKLEVQGYGTIYEGEFDGRKEAEKSNEIILVYEYISSGNLADKMRKRPNIIQRLEICLGPVQFEDWIIYIQAESSTPVPKRLEQNKLRKAVHFDIRKEIKEEALETYAKIACECVIENPEARPTMACVVEELEKALMLQGGVVSHVHIPSSINVATAPNETVVEAGPKEG